MAKYSLWLAPVGVVKAVSKGMGWCLGVKLREYGS